MGRIRINRIRRCQRVCSSISRTGRPRSGFGRSGAERIRQFAEILQREGITVTTRKTRGETIDAACGQLAGDVADRTRRTAVRRDIGVPIKEVRA